MSRGAVSLGLLGDVVLVSPGASLKLWPSVPRLRKLRVAACDRSRGTPADEVVAASFLHLVASASLRWDLLDGVGASDTSSFARGAVWTQVPRKVVEALYSFGETRDTALLLSTTGFPEPLGDAYGHCFGDHRRCWSERHGRRFSFCEDHINVEELRALIRFVQKVASWGCRRKRKLIGLGRSRQQGSQFQQVIEHQFSTLSRTLRHSRAQADFGLASDKA